MIFYSAFVIGLLLEGDLPTARADKLPGTKWSVEAIAPSTEQVLRVVAIEPAAIVRRSAAHVSTQTALPDGSVTQGGGTIHYAECQQHFDVREVLVGEAETGKRKLTYRYVEKTSGFPLPQIERAVPEDFAGLVLVGREGRIQKVFADTLKNRETISAAIEAAKKDQQAADVELIVAWLLNQDDQKVFPQGFGDSRILTDAKDTILYSDVDRVHVPKSLRSVPYEFLQPRLNRIRNGRKTSPAIVVTRSVKAHPQEEELLKELKAERRKPLKNARYYYVEVGIGSLAWHWMKIAIGERDGKQTAEILWQAVS